MQRATIDRAWATVLAAVVAVTMATTAVPIDLWVLDGWPAETVGIAYVLTLTVLAWRPARINTHKTALPLALTFWGGRAATALDDITQGAPTVRWAVAANAIGTAALVAALHVHAVRSLAVQQTMERARVFR